MEKNKNNHKNMASLTTEDCKNILLLLLLANIGTAVNKKNFNCFVLVIDIKWLISLTFKSDIFVIYILVLISFQLAIKAR